MQYGKDTLLIVNMLAYAAMLLALCIIWVRTPREKEPHLPWKLIGYAYLAMFRLSLNQFHLPLGLVFAALLLKRTTVNKQAKLRAVWLGGILFAASFLPVADWVEDARYPRTEMATYLNRDLTGKGFNLLFEREGRRFSFLTEDDAEGRGIYEALRQSAYVEENDDQRGRDTRYSMNLHQDHEEGMERFRRLDFRVSADGSYLTLRYEQRLYAFRTSPEFQRLFQQIVRERQ